MVFDKGNISRKNWGEIDHSKIGYVVSLTPSHHKEWAYCAREQLAPCGFPEDQTLLCLRTRAPVAGKERTLVVIDSPTLRDGQLRGLDQQLQPVLFALTHIEHALRNATRRLRREAIEQRIARALKRPVVRDLIRYELTEHKDRPGCWHLDWWIDMDAYHHLRDRIFGRRVLASNRDAWSTEDLVQAYWGQAQAELVFRDMKNPEALALRPQYHWTDQKIQVHSFCCFLAYLLAALLRREARTLGYPEELPALLQRLNDIRLVLRKQPRTRAGRPRIRWQLEESDPDSLRLYHHLVLPQYTLGPTTSGS
jgi:transposase